MPETARRPRLTTRLRSFFTSSPDTSTPLADSDAGPSKARTSNEYERNNGAPLLRPSPLVVPSARQAGIQPFGLHGLNDDSPPLTPTSDEGYEGRAKGHGKWPSWAPQGNSSSEQMLTPPLTASTPATSRTDSPALYAPSAMSLGTGGALAADGLLPHNIASHGVSSTPRRAFSMRDVTAQLEAGLRSRSLRQHMPTLLMLLTFFVFSTLVVVLLLTTLPLRMPSHSLTQLSLSEMRDLCLSLRDYASSNSHAYHHTLFVLCLFFTYKQAFNVPGSIVSNIVFGALFGTWRAAIWLSIFTAIGGSGAAIMSALVAPLVLKSPGMTKAVGVMRKALGGGVGTASQHIPLSRRGSRDQYQQRRRQHNRSATPSRSRPRSASPYPARANLKGSGGSSSGNLYSILLLLRVLPLTPYGVMNIACGILNVPLLPFATTLALGSLPWNAVTAQLGEILVEVVAALPVDAALADATTTLGEQLDAGGFHDAPLNPAVLHDVLASERTKLTSAAHKAGGGLKILMAKIWTREMLLKLVGLSMLSLAPVLLGRWWKARQAALQKKRRVEAGESRARELARAVNAKKQHLGADEDVGLVMPTAGASAGADLPSWVNQSSDDDASGLEEGEGEGGETWDFDSDFDDDDDYPGSEPDDGESGSAESLASPTSSTLGNFAASVATKTSHVGPALIASLTRSASRNSWTHGVMRKSSGVAASSSPQSFHHAWQSTSMDPSSSGSSSNDVSVPSDHSRSASKSFFSPTGPTTPQLEKAQDSFFDTRIHPTIDTSTPTRWYTPTHSRQASAASPPPGSGVKEPKRLRGVVIS